MSTKSHEGGWFEDSTEIEENPELPDVSHIKGGSEPESLEGYIEGDKESATVIINPRRIGDDWKNIPVESTYRLKNHQDSIKQRFIELAEDLASKKFSDWFYQGDDLSGAKKQFNHSLTYFINRLLNQQPDAELDEIIKLFEYPDLIWSMAKEIYIVDNTFVPMKSQNGYEHMTADSYQELGKKFIFYLKYLEKVKIYQADIKSEELLVLDPEHRWSKRYAKKMLAKFKDLEDSEFSEKYQTMITFTSYQSGELPDGVDKDRLSWFTAMENIKSGLRKILEILRHEGDLDYIWVFEPHKSGYPHVHLLIFGEVAEWLDNPENQKKIRELWTEKYDIARKTDFGGESGIGVDYTVKRPGENSNEEAPINSISNYLMKYFNKNFGERLSNYDDEDENFEDMNWGPIIYNACMCFTGYRTWGTSRDVGSVMKTRRNESGKVYKNLGGELTAAEDADFRSVVETKGDRQLNERLKQRDKLRNAIAKRKNV